jgi:ribonuclease P protein component
MVVFALPRPGGGEESRLGVTATRKLGGAVMRARCKRRLRELYRLHPGVLSGVAIDLVVNARRSSADAPWHELRQDYIDSVTRARDRLFGE